jgi:hypothetical protein
MPSLRFMRPASAAGSGMSRRLRQDRLFFISLPRKAKYKGMNRYYGSQGDDF